MNVKHLFFRVKTLTQKIVSSMIKDKGTFTAISLCVAVIGATAVFITTYNISSSTRHIGDTSAEDISIPITTTVSSQENKTSNIVAKSLTTRENPAAKPSQTSTTQNNIKKVTPSANHSKTADCSHDNHNCDKQNCEKTAASNFILPVHGNVLRGYSDSKIVYFKTLNEWRIHSGIDQEAPIGTPVKCTANGTVTDIKNDPRYGLMIIVEHPGSIKSIYANLSKDIPVVPNKKVKQSEVIGYVGNTAAFEKEDPPHLHFEITDKSNNVINPANVLAKS